MCVNDLLQSWAVAVRTLPDIFSCRQEKPSGRVWALSIPTLAKSYRWTGYLLSSREMNRLWPPVCGSLVALVTSSVLTVIDSFVIQLVPGEEIFQTIPKWARISQTGWRKRKQNKKKVSINWSKNFNKKSCCTTHWHFITSNPTIFRVFAMD